MLILVDNSMYFKFVIYALHECLKELGIKHGIIEDYYCDFNYNDNADDIYFICTTHEELRPVLPKRYISYNFEQLISIYDWDNTDIFKKLRNAELVFDYSLENIKFLKNHGINAHFLPLGFTNSMVYKKINDLERNIDFTFVGKFNQSRYDKLQPLVNIYNDNKEKLAILFDNKCWNEHLENIYTRTKIGINMHYFNSGKTILEITRIILYLANKVIVISERSDDEWYDNKYKDLIYFFENNNYAIDCVNVLQKYSIEKAEKNYQELITKHRYVDYVKDVIHLIQPFSELRY